MENDEFTDLHTKVGDVGMMRYLFEEMAKLKTALGEPEPKPWEAPKKEGEI